ncbi:putative GTPase or GTP-binding protein [Archaeoglobus sulfaticallidus PM70-1]|uniref:polynucleotide 5'-hydroxyl-kinase n=1 Tax=Archaeoglobus sulfaticallidus PM70-1 TaxID=387631 RepID=N0BJG9_9EURY|nr:Clp1/GlmU family protein [Archaeoglobus sulfaticallidus]AGK60300.1 putative GTPase or GTP-binding protein [Archaeoglobus sulfaticallidus PM70-1]
MILEEKKNTTLIIKGPSEIRVIKGIVSVFGCRIDQLSIAKEKTIPVYLEEDSTIEIPDNTFYIPVNGSTIPESWEKLVKKFRNKSNESFFIYGESDSGKSSIAAYLSNRLDGKKVIVDLDIGQASVSHPASMGIGITDGRITSISDVRVVDGAFVGSISPVGRETRCINAVMEIRKKIRKLEGWKIIDSTGWIRGRRANEYKLAKISILEPTAIIAFKTPPFLDFIDCDVFMLESFAGKRSKNQRSSYRAEKYSKFLEGASIIELNLKNLKSRWNPIGDRISRDELEILKDILDTEVVYAGKGSYSLSIVTVSKVEVGREVVRSIKEMFGIEDLLMLSKDDLDGLVVGFYAKDGRYLGFGLIRNIDFEKGLVEIQTSVSGEIARIEFAEFRLDDNRREIFLRSY